jgi:predicted RNA-binding Zn-ribbon protein involved in translation (DUF1610 family)
MKQKFFCDNCGTAVDKSELRCPRCGRYFKSVKCPACGYAGGHEEFTDGCPACGYAGSGSRHAAGGRAEKKKSSSFLPLAFYRILIPLLVITLLLISAWLIAGMR